ncbi:MAG: UTP--glucose-1-phosphate uridylyltransferase GalU [Bacilli bacterium]
MNKIRKLVIPVAGLGTRFLPATKSMPKEMLSIIDKPTIQYIVEEAVASGIKELLFITSPYKKAIEDHFDKSYELEKRLEKSSKKDLLKEVQNISDMIKIYYVRQGEPLGSGHAINLAKTFIGDEYFAVMFGDDLIVNDKPALKQLIDIHEKTGSSVIGVQEVSNDIISRYGVIKPFDDMKIETIIEKPSIDEAPSNLAVFGRYVVSPKIFDELDNLNKGVGNEYQFTDGLKKLMEKESFYACKIEGKYYDIGNKSEFVKATIDLALTREDLKEEIREYIKKII